MFNRENITLFKVLNNEIIFTEYFCNLLNIDEFRELFINFLNEKIEILPTKKSIKYTNFNTEVDLVGQYGRADLFLKVDSKEFIFEIKNKDTTKLTENQPSKYLKYLKNENKNLIFLIPKGYKYTDKIMNRWKNYKKSSIKNQIFYWQDFIFRIRDIKTLEIKMFYEFCEYWFNMKPIILNDNEKKLIEEKGILMNDFTNITIPKLMVKLIEIIEHVGNNRNMKRFNDSFSEGFYYQKSIKDYIVYFGIDYDYWESTGTPLTIIIQNKDYSNFNLEEIEELDLNRFDSIETVSAEYFGYYVNTKGILLEDDYQNIIENKILRVEQVLNEQ